MFLCGLVFPVYDLFSSSFHMHYCIHISEVSVQKPVIFWDEKKRDVFHILFISVGFEQMQGIGLVLLPYLDAYNSTCHSKPWLPSNSSFLGTSSGLFWTVQTTLFLGKLQEEIQHSLQERKNTNMTF